MTNLKPVTALGETAPCIDVIGSLTITENPDSAFVSLAARSGTEQLLAKKVRTLTGLDLPEAGICVVNDTFTIWWTGVDQWMIGADHATHELLANIVKDAVGSEGSVTEQGDGWCRFDVAGMCGETLFERLCPADVRSMDKGTAKRTTIHHLGCFLIRMQSNWTVMGPRSSAGSLHHALLVAANSIA